MRIGLAACLAGAVLVAPLSADDLGTLQPGARIRMRMRQGAGKVTGTLIEVRGTEVVLSEGPTVSLASVERLQLSKGRGRRWREGAAVGALVGAFWSSGECLRGCTVGGPGCDDFDESCLARHTLLTATVGSLGGLLVVHERWGEVSLEPRVMTHGRGATVRIAWR